MRYTGERRRRDDRPINGANFAARPSQSEPAPKHGPGFVGDSGEQRDLHPVHEIESISTHPMALPFIHDSFVEWAGQTINKSFWAGAYYRQQRAKGSSHQAAVRALAFKWIRILYRCWKTGTRYDESIYLNALRKRGSPLLQNLGLPG